MIDEYGRNLNYLRISVTDRCNLRCVYCMPPEGVVCKAHEDILSYEEIEKIVRILVPMGIHSIRLTGGEPLVRKNISRLISILKKIDGVDWIGLTTNGYFLVDQLDGLIDAGLDAVNISLDTCDAEKYARITRGGDVKKVMAGIKASVESGKLIVKINSVLTGDDWEKDVLELARLAKEQPVSVRYIEKMPLGQSDVSDTHFQAAVMAVLKEKAGDLTPAKGPQGRGPGVYYQPDDFKGYIGFISAVSHKFCSQCNRLRLTADGNLRMCLQSGEEVALRDILRRGDTQKLQDTIKYAVKHKPLCHTFEESGIETKGMNSIGG